VSVKFPFCGVVGAEIIAVIGSVLSTFAGFDVTDVVLHNPASLHTAGVILHVIPDHSPIVHVTGVHDIIGAILSVYVNIDVCEVAYHHENIVLLTNVGTVLSNLIGFEITYVVLQFPTLSHIFGLVIVQVAHDSSVLIVHHVFCDAGHAHVSA